MPFLIVLIGLVPALVVLFYFRALDDYATRAEAVWGAFGIGACVLIPAVALELLPMAVLEHLYGPLGQSPDNLYTTGFLKAFTVAALPEEAFKLLAVLCYAIRHIDCRRPHDIVVLSVAVAMGFAAFENIGYLFGEEPWPAVAVVRSLTAVPGHAFAGAVMGGCLAAAELGGRRWFYWPAAYLVPVLLHGFYDFPLFVLSDIEAHSLVELHGVVPFLILGVVATLVFGGFLALFSSRRVLAAERHKGIVPEHPGVGRLLGWWVARRRLQRAVWGISGILFTAGGLLLLVALTPFLVPNLKPTSVIELDLGRGLPTEFEVVLPGGPTAPHESQLGVAFFGLFALLYGVGFLYQARRVSKSVSPDDDEARAIPKRPLIITIFCIIGFLAALLVLLGLLFTEAGSLQEQYGPSSLFVVGVGAVASLIALIGYWMMRKWGVYLFIALFLTTLVYSVIIGVGPLNVDNALLIPVVVVGLGYLRRMK